MQRLSPSVWRTDSHRVFNLDATENIERIVSGEDLGTLVITE